VAEVGPSAAVAGGAAHGGRWRLLVAVAAGHGQAWAAFGGGGGFPRRRPNELVAVFHGCGFGGGGFPWWHGRRIFR